MPDTPQPITTTGEAAFDVGRDLVAPLDRPAVGAVELHVLEEHRHHDALDRLAREERHHLEQDVARQLWGTQPPSR